MQDGVNEELPPSVARAEAEALHSEIRDALRGTLDALARLSARQPGAEDDVRAAARSVSEAVRKHNDVESRLLAPVLAKIDAWGAEREQALRRGHLDAAHVVEAATELPDEADELRATVEHLVRDVLRVLRAEERNLLDPEVLRDDPIVCDQTDG